MREVYIQHKASGKYAFAAPSDPHNDSPSVRGRVCLRSAPFAWRYDVTLKRIFAGASEDLGVWDTYNDVPPASAIRLYSRVTDSPRQEFDLSNPNGIGGVLCSVVKNAVTAVPASSANRVDWVVQNVPKASSPKASSPKATTSVVTTYNALMSSCSAGQLSEYESETGEPKYQPWPVRMPMMVKKLQERGSDILLLNEVNRKMVNDIAKPLGMSSAVGPSAQFLQCAVAWNHRYSKKGSAIYPDGDSVRCVIQRLIRDDGCEVLVGSAHLKAGESDHDESIRATQINTILASFAKLDPAQAYVFGGDLNSDSSLDWYRSKVVHKMLADGWTNVSGEKPTYLGDANNGWASKTRIKFDYIFVKHASARGHAQVDVLTRSGPNAQQPSDHTPVTVTLHFGKQTPRRASSNSSSAKRRSAAKRSSATASPPKLLVKLSVAKKPSPKNAVWPAVSIVSPTSGEPVEMTSTAKPGGLFKHPVYLSQHARLSAKQVKKQPVMLVHAADWQHLKKPATTHDGAFGSDHAEVGSVSGLEGKWFAVWKFPWDLNLVPGFERIRFPVPVGNYPLLPDEWSGYEHGDENADFRIGDDAEKFRTDVTLHDSVHHLEARNGAKLAMFGSRSFINDLWNVTKEEQKRVRRVIADLAKVGVCAFSCWGQHHGLVFYRDTVRNRSITPARMAQLLQDPASGVLQILNENAVDTLDTWAKNYIRVYAKHK